MEIKVKKIDKSDWKQYKEIRLEALKNDPSAFGSSYELESKQSDEEWQKRFEDSDSQESKKVFYAAQSNEQLIAIGGAFRDENKEWNVIAIYTKPDKRGMGIGGKLLSSILDDLRTRSVSKAFLRVNINQAAAISLYKKVGFTILSTHKNQLLGDGNYYDEYEMVYELQ